MNKLNDVRAVFEKIYKEQTVFIENTHGYDSQKFAIWAGFQLGWQAFRECYKQEINQQQADEFNREQMKLGVLFARNHLISAYRANFIDCDSKEFAKFMGLLIHVANESIDIELMMGDVLACNEQAEEWIKSALEQKNEI